MGLDAFWATELPGVDDGCGSIVLFYRVALDTLIRRERSKRKPSRPASRLVGRLHEL
jgi:hypothetical protein